MIASARSIHPKLALHSPRVDVLCLGASNNAAQLQYEYRRLEIVKDNKERAL